MNKKKLFRFLRYLGLALVPLALSTNAQSGSKNGNVLFTCPQTISCKTQDFKSCSPVPGGWEVSPAGPKGTYTFNNVTWDKGSGGWCFYRSNSHFIGITAPGPDTDATLEPAVKVAGNRWRCNSSGTSCSCGPTTGQRSSLNAGQCPFQYVQE